VQHVHSPTRRNNTLDLVLTDKLEPKGDIIVMAPVDNFDHNVLTTLEMDCNINTTLSNRTKLLYNQADYDAVRHFVKGRLANLNSTFMSASIPCGRILTVLCRMPSSVLFQFAPVVTRESNHYG